MKKPELIEAVSKSTGEDMTTCTKIISSLLDNIINTLASGEDINLYGFGNFKVIDVPERERKNPKTGEMKLVPAKKNPKFYFSSAIKNKINE